MHTSGSIKYNDGISDDILPSNDNGHSSFFLSICYFNKCYLKC